jgi:hypothetical protein
MGWTTEIRTLVGQNFILPHEVQTGYGAHTASYPKDTEVPFVVIKQPGSEVNHSSPSSVEAKNAVELYLHSLIRLHGVVLN